MEIFDHLTSDTLITVADYRNDSVATIPNKKRIFYKDFDINEFIGEKLADRRNIKTNHYFLLSFLEGLGEKKYKDIMSDYGSEKIPIKIASFDFEVDQDQCLRYYNFEEILEFCPTKKNREEFTKEVLEMFALDTYMGQVDRMRYNYMIQVDSNFDIHLGPLYDYECSLNIDYLDDKAIYKNTLHKLDTIMDYKNTIDKYEYFYECLKSYLDVDLCSVIQDVFDDRKLDITGLELDKYKRFEEISQKLLSKILR